MNVLRTLKELHQFVIEQKQAGKEIGFVPTMGFLHDGHISLIKKSKKIQKKHW